MTRMIGRVEVSDTFIGACEYVRSQIPRLIREGYRDQYALASVRSPEKIAICRDYASALKQGLEGDDLGKFVVTRITDSLEWHL